MKNTNVTCVKVNASNVSMPTTKAAIALVIAASNQPRLVIS